jgi:hypothetical protein
MEGVTMTEDVAFEVGSLNLNGAAFQQGGDLVWYVGIINEMLNPSLFQL